MNSKYITTDYTFEIGTKVFYPTHGAGWIKDRKFIEFQGKRKEYYEFEFVDNQLTVSTPVENINSLGIRPIMTPAEIESKIAILQKKPTLKPEQTDYNELMQFIQDLDNIGEIDAFIQIIQYCNNVKKGREKEGRLIPVSITKHIKTSIAHIVAELALTKGITVEEAEAEFKGLTAIEA